MLRLWIKNPLAIFANNCGSGVVVEGSRIVECLPTGRRPEQACDYEFDASEHVVLPGLINTHHHFYQTLTRAYGPALNQALFGWLRTLYPVWAKLTPEFLDIATRLALTELLLSGCTTAGDHHYLFPEGLENAIDIQAAAAKNMGVRVTLTRGSMDLSVRDGGLPPENTVQDADSILQDSERVIHRFHDGAAGSYCQIALAPCSPFSVSKEVMQGSVELAEKNNVRLHTHLAETQDENEFCQRRFGCRPLDYLEELGWLSNQVWLAHGIHFNKNEIQRLGQASLSIAHCPGSNMLLGSGICRAAELEEAGANVGIGVDGSASEDASNLIQEIRLALQIQRLRYGATRITHEDVIRWATVGSAKCLGRNDIGVIKPGKQADLAMFKLDELRFSGVSSPLAALVLCGAHRADRVMVGGQWRVIDGEIPNLDITKLMNEHRQAAKSLIET